ARLLARDARWLGSSTRRDLASSQPPGDTWRRPRRSHAVRRRAHCARWRSQLRAWPALATAGRSKLTPTVLPPLISTPTRSPARNTTDAPSASGRHQERVDLSRLLTHLEPDAALAKQCFGRVEGMNLQRP